jgi:hypothetical protein
MNFLIQNQKSRKRKKNTLYIKFDNMFDFYTFSKFTFNLTVPKREGYNIKK